MAVDLTKFEAKCKAITDAVRPAREFALKTLMEEMAAAVVAECPKDTNRLVRGYIQAFNEMKLKPIALPPLKKSKNHDFYKQKLSDQVEKWTGIVNRHDAAGRSDTKQGKKARWVLDRAREELAKVDEFSLFIENKGGRQDKGRRLTITVRPKIYGGKGGVSSDEIRTTYIGTNLEPHAIIREREKRMIAARLAKLKAFGTKNLKASMLRKILKAEEQVASATRNAKFKAEAESYAGDVLLGRK